MSKHDDLIARLDAHLKNNSATAWRDADDQQLLREARAALVQMQHCVACDMDWRGPYGDCPGCQAQAGMLAVSRQAHEIAAHERRIMELTEARNTVLRRLTEAEARVQMLIDRRGAGPTGAGDAWLAHKRHRWSNGDAD